MFFDSCCDGESLEMGCYENISAHFKQNFVYDSINQNSNSFFDSKDQETISENVLMMQKANQEESTQNTFLNQPFKYFYNPLTIKIPDYYEESKQGLHSGSFTNFYNNSNQPTSLLTQTIHNRNEMESEKENLPNFQTTLQQNQIFPKYTSNFHMTQPYYEYQFSHQPLFLGNQSPFFQQKTSTPNNCEDSQRFYHSEYNHLQPPELYHTQSINPSSQPSHQSYHSESSFCMQNDDNYAYYFNPHNESISDPPCNKNSRRSKRNREVIRTNNVYRNIYSKQVRNCLEEHYVIDKFLDPSRREKIMQLTGLSKQQINVWFQNRRVKEKKENKP